MPQYNFIFSYMKKTRYLKILCNRNTNNENRFKIGKCHVFINTDTEIECNIIKVLHHSSFESNMTPKHLFEILLEIFSIGEVYWVLKTPKYHSVTQVLSLPILN